MKKFSGDLGNLRTLAPDTRIISDHSEGTLLDTTFLDRPALVTPCITCHYCVQGLIAAHHFRRYYLLTLGSGHAMFPHVGRGGHVKQLDKVRTDLIC